ncbi:MAG: HAMP domain-containing protein [Sandaracinaceae bacterium]|jgi:two-component system NtrC family sensor kinase|nr:HAMP domain-containing protein [Sandaracinaceae bacterium]
MKQASLGLRAQLVIALTLAFLAATLLLGFAAVRLTERVRDVDRLRDARATLRALQVALEAGPAIEERAIREVLRGDEIAGVRIAGPGGIEVVHGQTSQADTVTTTLQDGRSLSLYLKHRRATSAVSFTSILMLYAGVTVVAILFLTYMTLTRLFVTPVERLTRASERLATGNLQVSVPVTGAAEVAQLAAAFNQMAGQLRRDRGALEERLRELEATTKELQSAQEQVVRSEKLASVGRLAAGIAHEIGNPLAAILGLVDLMRQGGLDSAEEKEFLSRIHGETERIHRIIRDLLDFARHGQRDAKDDASVANVRAVVDDAVSLVAPQKDLRAIVIEREIADVPDVRGSSDRLTQVVLNLLLNAADAMQGAGVIRISVEHDATAETVRLIVSDTGPGIAKDILPRLFEPFVTSKPAGEGTGLGLAVCHTLVEEMGGTLRAENAPDGGARFTVALRLAR